MRHWQILGSLVLVKSSVLIVNLQVCKTYRYMQFILYEKIEFIKPNRITSIFKFISNMSIFIAMTMLKIELFNDILIYKYSNGKLYRFIKMIFRYSSSFSPVGHISSRVLYVIYKIKYSKQSLSTWYGSALHYAVVFLLFFVRHNGLERSSCADCRHLGRILFSGGISLILLN